MHCGRRGGERAPVEGWATATVCLSWDPEGPRSRLAASALHGEGRLRRKVEAPGEAWGGGVG